MKAHARTAFPAEWKIVRHHHTKTLIPVDVMRVVPVANRTADVVFIVVERAAANHTTSIGLSLQHMRLVLPPRVAYVCVTFIHPPNNLPISSNMEAAC